MAEKESRPMFALGRVSVTPKVLEYLAEAEVGIRLLLHRHQHGDWRDTANAERDANYEALRRQSVVQSEHRLEATGKCIRIVTLLDLPLTRMIALEEWKTEVDFLNLDLD